MSEYKQLMKTLFSSWSKTHQLSSRIVNGQIRRNQFKRLQANYRVFQNQVGLRYDPQEQIDAGLIRYHHNLAQCQYRLILAQNIQLSSKCYKLNPYPLRQQLFGYNREQKSKIKIFEFTDESQNAQ